MKLQSKSSLLPCALTLLLLVSASQATPVWAQSARDREEKAQPKPSSSSSSSSSDRSSSSSSSSSNDQPARDREERSQQTRSKRNDRDNDRVVIYNDPYYNPYGYGYGGVGNSTYFRGRRFAPRIAFISDRDGCPDLYMMWENGAYLERLTRTPGVEMQPEFSPRKGRLAFVQDAGGQIVVMNADGAKRMEINVRSLAPVRDLVWQPDDKRIAFVSEREGNAEIYTIEPSGRNLHRLTNHPAADTQPIFSPSGGNMVFVSTREGKPALYAMRTDGTGEVRRISPTDLPPISDPAYSPDGNSVVFVAGEGATTDLFLMDMTTGVVRKIAINMGRIRNPVYSPEGNRIAFSANRPGYFALFTISPFSNSATNIPDPKDVVQITFGPWNDTEPTWW